MNPIAPFANIMKDKTTVAKKPDIIPFTYLFIAILPMDTRRRSAVAHTSTCKWSDCADLFDYFGAQGFELAPHGFAFAAQGLAFAAQGFSLAAQGLAAAQGLGFAEHGLAVAEQGFA
jgi:hypothetical protein